MMMRMILISALTTDRQELVSITIYSCTSLIRMGINVPCAFILDCCYVMELDLL